MGDFSLLSGRALPVSIWADPEDDQAGWSPSHTPLSIALQPSLIPRDRETFALTSDGQGDDQVAGVPAIGSRVAALIGPSPYWSLVKTACITECSETSLPSYDFGWRFQNCVRDCMLRHGCDPNGAR